MQANLKMGDLFEDFSEFSVSLFEENLVFIFSEEQVFSCISSGIPLQNQ